MPMLLGNLAFPPKLTAQNPQNAPLRAKNMGRLKIPVFLTPGRECMGFTLSTSEMYQSTVHTTTVLYWHCIRGDAIPRARSARTTSTTIPSWSYTYKRWSRAPTPGTTCKGSQEPAYPQPQLSPLRGPDLLALFHGRAGKQSSYWRHDC